MLKLYLVLSCISLVFAIVSDAAAKDDTDLLKQAQGIFKPLPKPVVATDHPATAARVELGRMLFFDPRLTIDGNMSCSTCHQPAR
jgi:cytochrome c peroxidase